MKRRRNTRRQTVQSKAASCCFGFALLAIVACLMIGLVVQHECASCAQQIKRLERQCATLEQTQLREQAVWDSMRTPEELESAMVRHGLMLTYPTGDQVVRVHKSGRMRASRTLLATVNSERNSLSGTQQTRVHR